MTKCCNFNNLKNSYEKVTLLISSFSTAYNLSSRHLSTTIKTNCMLYLDEKIGSSCISKHHTQLTACLRTRQPLAKPQGRYFFLASKFKFVEQCHIFAKRRFMLNWNLNFILWWELLSIHLSVNRMLKLSEKKILKENSKKSSRHSVKVPA